MLQRESGVAVLRVVLQRCKMMPDMTRRVYPCFLAWYKPACNPRSYYAGVALTPDDPEAGARIALQTMALMQVRGLPGSHAEVARSCKIRKATCYAALIAFVRPCWMLLTPIDVNGLCC